MLVAWGSRGRVLQHDGGACYSSSPSSSRIRQSRSSGRSRLIWVSSLRLYLRSLGSIPLRDRELRPYCLRKPPSSRRMCSRRPDMDRTVCPEGRISPSYNRRSTATVTATDRNEDSRPELDADSSPRSRTRTDPAGRSAQNLQARGQESEEAPGSCRFQAVRGGPGATNDDHRSPMNGQLRRHVVRVGRLRPRR